MNKRLVMLPTFLGISLLLAAGAQATPATAEVPSAPGVAPSRYGWEYDIEVANSLFANGYLNEAETDFTKILTAYPDGIPGIDQAWLGLAKVHQAKGEIAKSRASLQEVLRRDSSPITAAEARETYRNLRSEALVELNEAQRAVIYYDNRCRSISWWNPFGKLFAWLDVRKAKKTHKELQDNLLKFDPRYLIDPIAKPAAVASIDLGTGLDAKASTDLGTLGTSDGEYRLTPEEMAALLQSAGGTPVLADSSTAASSSTEQGTSPEVATTSEEPASGTGGEVSIPTGTGNAVSDLDQIQKAYFASYQDLRQALTGSDPDAIKQAQEGYAAAKRAYEEAKLGQVNGS